MTLSAGSRLGPYEILSPLGAGGMGEVYKARDTRLERTVAVKVLPSHKTASPEVRQRFEREAKTISQLSHPHICALHDVGREGETEYLVMEFLEGETLSGRLAKGPLPLESTLRYGQEIADALDKAHRQGFVHRDLKPANVMLTKSGVKLLDFGLAKTFERPLDAAIHGQAAPGQHPTAKSSFTSVPTVVGGPNLTQEGAILGTVQYMAPEQLEGKEADARTDIFAFGAVLYEMATGKKAFSGTSQASLISSIMSSEPSPISKVKPLSPPALDRIVGTCLAKDPEERWQSAADVKRELRWIAEGSQTGAVPASSATRGSWLPWTIAALAVIVAAGSLLWQFGSARAKAPPPNPRPVIVLMDSPLPGRVYDPRTLAEGGTNADDITDALRTLPVVIAKENTSPMWHREDEVARQNPDLIISHLSCLYDGRVAQGQEPIEDHLFSLAESRLGLFFGYVANANSRTRFLVYSRARFGGAAGEMTFVEDSEARLPVLRGRIYALTIPGGNEHATFRDPDTVRLIRGRVSTMLGLNPSK